MSGKFLNVCFTLNNPTDPIPFDVEQMHYLTYQHEVGEEGTPHFQGYCEFKKQKRMAAAKALLGGTTVHLERRKGTAQEALDYCHKDDTRSPDGVRVEFGEPKVTNQGARADLESFKDAVAQGKRKRDLIDEHFTVIAKYPRFYAELQHKRPKRPDPPRVILHYGPTGLGKTRAVYDAHGEDEELYVAPLSNGTVWYDGYDGHKIVLIDDFAGSASHMQLTYLLRLLDRYSVQVPTKGGHTWFSPAFIYVTTNIHPSEWYKWDKREGQYRALQRRFTSTILFEGTTAEPTKTDAPPSFWDDKAPVIAGNWQ